MSQELIRAAIDAAKLSGDEPGKAGPVPRVGAAVLFPDGEIISAYRGEKCSDDIGEKYKGHHAEYILLKKKLAGRNLAECVLATTLEPCSKRGTNKTPCCEHIIDSGIKKVFIGILDPNPTIYEHGCRKLKASGVEISFFDKDQRTEISEITQDFIEQYDRSQALEGVVSFDYEKNGGRFIFGSGDFEFITVWSGAGTSSVHCYSQNGYAANVLLTYCSETEFSQIHQSDHLDYNFKTISPQVGTIALAKNPKGHFMAFKIIAVQERLHPSVGINHPLSASVRVEYKITQHPLGDFRDASSPYLIPSDYTEDWINRTLQKAAIEVGPQLKRKRGLSALTPNIWSGGNKLEDWEILPDTISYKPSVRPVATEKDCRTFKVQVDKTAVERETISLDRRSLEAKWVLDVTLEFKNNIPSALLIKRITDVTADDPFAEINDLPEVDIQKYL